MKVIITGASGYIGKHVMNCLLEKTNLEIVGVVHELRGGSKYNLVAMDLFDAMDVKKFKNLINPGDCLIHLAYRNGFDHSNISHFNDLAWHYELIKHAVRSGCTNINVMGSVHEIGYYDGEVFNNTICSPTNLYGIAKNALRQALFALGSKEQFMLKWMRGFYIYGDDACSKSIFGKIYRNSKQQLGEVDLTRGTNKFDFIHISELARMISAVSLQTEVTGIINTCSGQPLSLKNAIMNYVKENRLDIKLNFGKYPEREDESPCIFGNNDIVEAILSKCPYGF